jgi:TetR/AcrR family transcriptional regulator, regulator of autoinduction and epiphytic fitness
MSRLLPQEQPPVPQSDEDPRVTRSKERILAACRDLLSEGGPSALTIDAVVERSAVSRMTIYRHWPSREALVVAGFQALVPRPGPPPLPAVADPVQALTQAVVAYGREFAEAEWSEAMPGLLDYSRQHPDAAQIWIDFAEARGNHLAGLLAECMEAGACADVEIDTAISQLMGPIAFRRFLSFEPITDEFCTSLVQDLVAAHSPSRR